MIDRVLIDSLNMRHRDFAIRWKDLIRANPQLKHYCSLDDEALIENNGQFYPLLAKALDRGLERSMIGDFFTKLGKERLHGHFSVSEVTFGMYLTQKVVVDFLMTEFAPDNPMRMYQSLGAINKISEFFILGNFYITKGFLEETYTRMSNHDKISEELLKKYFKDDFFFKNG